MDVVKYEVKICGRKDATNNWVNYFVGSEKIKFQGPNLVHDNFHAALSAWPNLENISTQNCSTAVTFLQGTERHDIFLPELDPSAFHLFLHLLSTNTWSVEALQKLYLSRDMFYGLFAICRHFGVTEASANLEEAGLHFTMSFNEFKETDEFLNMPRVNLEALLSCQKIPCMELTIYKSAWKWAMFQCIQKGLALTGEHVRLVLGRCLYEIRFPILTGKQFAWDVGLIHDRTEFDNLLNLTETIAIHDLRQKKLKSSGACDQPPFKTHLRNKSSKLCLINGCEILNVAGIHPSDKKYCVWIQTDKTVALLELEFYGILEMEIGRPVLGVIVQIKRLRNSWCVYESDVHEEDLHQEENKVFRLTFYDPIILEAIPNNSTWNDRYVVEFSVLEFHKEVKRKVGDETNLHEDGTQFRFNWNHDGKNPTSNPISAIVYNNIIQ